VFVCVAFDYFNINLGQVYVFGSNCGDNASVEIYSPTLGGHALTTRIVGSYDMAAVSIGNYMCIRAEAVVIIYRMLHKYRYCLHRRRIYCLDGRGL
jgi:hypothetical protein